MSSQSSITSLQHQRRELRGGIKIGPVSSSSFNEKQKKSAKLFFRVAACSTKSRQADLALPVTFSAAAAPALTTMYIYVDVFSFPSFDSSNTSKKKLLEEAIHHPQKSQVSLKCRDFFLLPYSNFRSISSDPLQHILFECFIFILSYFFFFFCI